MLPWEPRRSWACACSTSMVGKLACGKGRLCETHAREPCRVVAAGTPLPILCVSNNVSIGFGGFPGFGLACLSVYLCRGFRHLLLHVFKSTCTCCPWLSYGHQPSAAPDPLLNLWGFKVSDQILLGCFACILMSGFPRDHSWRWVANGHASQSSYSMSCHFSGPSPTMPPLSLSIMTRSYPNLQAKSCRAFQFVVACLHGLL